MTKTIARKILDAQKSILVMYVHNILGQTIVDKEENYRSGKITDYWHYCIKKKQEAQNKERIIFKRKQTVITIVRNTRDYLAYSISVNHRNTNHP